MNYSIVIPAKNEEQGLEAILPKLIKTNAVEIIVVDDASTDGTLSICEKFGVRVVKHSYSKGNGAAIKAGARAASTDYILFMDADGQHQPEDIELLVSKIEFGNDMVVGARGAESQAGLMRGLGNRFYNWFASKIVGHKIEDLTSGFRIVERSKFLQFIHLLPNGFSYPTTITMAFFRAGYSVEYQSVSMPERMGSSHLNVYRDGIKFLLIIFKIGTLYSPLKIFFPLSLIHLILGLFYYFYTFVTVGRFTNMGAVLLTTGVVIFLIGLVSEQISNLQYKP